RKRNRQGVFYANEELYEKFNYMKKKHIYGTASFIIGIPGETKYHFRETIEMIDSLKKYDVDTVPGVCKLEPGSPMFLTPEKFGVQLYRHSFNDYYEHTRALTLSLPTEHPLGFRTEHLSEKDIIRLQFEAYRKSRFRTRYFISRIRNLKRMNRMNFLAFLAVLFNSESMLQKVQRE
ncbi:MAG: hypothetical protein AB1546_00675, partial [bacterium]